MPNVATVLKQEITRLARKEARAQSASSKKAIAQHRRDIAELKRQVRALAREVGDLRRQQKRVGRPATHNGNASVRFSPSWVKSHRERLELSAADYAELVGVSALTIYNWEKGKTKPGRPQLVAWAEVRTLGKRDALQRLEMTDA